MTYNDIKKSFPSKKKGLVNAVKEWMDRLGKEGKIYEFLNQLN